MTTFVKNVNENYSIDYGKVLEMKKTIEREITTVDEYVQWVRDWRKLNASLVASIQYMRDVKNDIKTGRKASNSDRGTAINRAYGTKLELRPHARKLYELRVENKARFKAGEFGDPTLRAREGLEGVLVA
ncbi:hypothetical protein PHIM7_117 [Sinorhizobium phage phiM7]|uniref:Uncharacterized protein n=2 Tax=Emdodecavirus TaxID=1980937 RepID=S5MB06_9CAUD|nr:hypothetical protein AB690_gp377 [Sinorhizobium phage phiM12]YP_009601242.1 hypothetical protein FDH46_gp361 [Sinorhizobium phage phiM7]AGR47808.1 hypothetical protein SmphiM12_176 [Sinorhizobium phage phiM12]AKF12663.1 hypothetical protein PHIM7_117 [Sinorhizobium phage phiM7]AKF13024.1 hypothetical protein PHIM19_118 [Sinorhizobium phage phiM19]